MQLAPPIPEPDTTFEIEELEEDECLELDFQPPRDTGPTGADNDADNSWHPTLGALIGGLLLGAFITVRFGKDNNTDTDDSSTEI